MKPFYHIIFLATYLLLTWQCTQAPQYNEVSSAADSIYTYKYITKIHLTEPQRALKLVDEAVNKKVMSDFKANNLRAIIYGGMRMWHMEEEYMEKLNRSDSMKLISSKLYMDIKSRMVQCYIRSSKYQQALDIATEIIQKAREAGFRKSESRMLVSVGKIYQKQFSYAMSDQYYDQAAQVLEKSSKIDELGVLSYVYGIQMISFSYREEYDKAIQIGEKRKLLIDRMKEMSGAPEGFIDSQYGFLFSKMAVFYFHNKQPDKAAEAFRQYRSTQFSQTDGKIEAIPYLMLMGKYDEAESSIPHIDSYGTDTICTNFLLYLQNKSEIASKSGDYRAALDYKDRYTVIQDSIYARDKQDAALELATIYETNQKNLQIKDQKARIDRQRIILAFALGILFLAGLVLYLIFNNLRSTKRKNRYLAEQIDSQLAYREKLKKANTEIDQLRQQLQAAAQEKKLVLTIEEENEPKTSVLDKKLFDKLERLLDEEMLYLNPDITRDQLIKQIHIPKNAFGQLIQTYTGTNFKAYINNKRLEYSLILLKDSQNHTIESVAVDSGFNNARSFYRIFRERYGMTPSEYRDIRER